MARFRSDEQVIGMYEAVEDDLDSAYISVNSAILCLNSACATLRKLHQPLITDDGIVADLIENTLTKELRQIHDQIDRVEKEFKKLHHPPREDLVALGRSWAADYVHDNGIEEAIDQAPSIACDVAFSNYPNCYDYAADTIYEGMNDYFESDEWKDD